METFMETDDIFDNLILFYMTRYLSLMISRMTMYMVSNALERCNQVMSK